MYTDLTNEQEKYVAISKIGVTGAEMKRSATIQQHFIFRSVRYGVHSYNVRNKNASRRNCLITIQRNFSCSYYFGVVEIVFSFIHSFLLHAKVIRVYKWLNFMHVFSRGKGISYILFLFILLGG